jgi:hypothetical protein
MIVLSVHPGWVKTGLLVSRKACLYATNKYLDMGTSLAPLEPSEVVREMIQLLRRVTLADSGKFVRYDGLAEVD